jgi:hypothetical protein
MVAAFVDMAGVDPFVEMLGVDPFVIPGFEIAEDSVGGSPDEPPGDPLHAATPTRSETASKACKERIVGASAGLSEFYIWQNKE